MLPHSNGILLTQQKYIRDLLLKTNMVEAKPVSSPMAVAPALSKSDTPLFEDPTLFRSTVGSLQYLSLTRPDVAFAVNRVCQFMQSPRLSH